MKRLSYIYCSIPAAFALSILEGFHSGQAHVSIFWISLIPAIVLWGATWLRLHTTRALREEFSALTVLPALLFYAVMAGGAELQAQLQSNAWLWVFAILWMLAAFVFIKALKPSAAERQDSAGRGDSVFCMMSILAVAYCVYNWTFMSMVLFEGLIKP